MQLWRWFWWSWWCVSVFAVRCGMIFDVSLFFIVIIIFSFIYFYFGLRQAKKNEEEEEKKLNWKQNVTNETPQISWWDLLLLLEVAVVGRRQTMCGKSKDHHEDLTEIKMRVFINIYVYICRFEKNSDTHPYTHMYRYMWTYINICKHQRIMMCVTGKYQLHICMMGGGVGVWGVVLGLLSFDVVYYMALQYNWIYFRI